HFLDLDGKYNDKFAEVMEDIVVGVADDSIAKDDLNQILQNFIDKNIEVEG
ncbi:type II toxin-antitoxin system death-on-curing family toxin, partial [Campylobacter jejuni]|nr:type II toxin-antitoxin system death-on-curing family toxin [Campylobacter jejuni]